MQDKTRNISHAEDVESIVFVWHIFKNIFFKYIYVCHYFEYLCYLIFFFCFSPEIYAGMFRMYLEYFSVSWSFSKSESG